MSRGALAERAQERRATRQAAVERAIGNETTRRAMLFDVLNARYGKMRPTVLIGNQTVAEMEDYLGQRIMDRLLELGSATVPFTWPSHRRQACGA